jgi:hypothetical protein
MRRLHRRGLIGTEGSRAAARGLKRHSVQPGPHFKAVSRSPVHRRGDRAKPSLPPTPASRPPDREEALHCPAITASQKNATDMGMLAQDKRGNEVGWPDGGSGSARCQNTTTPRIVKPFVLPSRPHRGPTRASLWSAAVVRASQSVWTMVIRCNSDGTSPERILL